MTKAMRIGIACLGLFFALSIAAPAAARGLPAVVPAVPCQSLRGFDPKLASYPTQITDAHEIDGQCRVQGIVSPQIRFEVRLPLQGWTQRFLETGCGGFCGQLDIRSPQRACPALVRGEFALASTNMGHEGMGGVWGASDQQLRADFGYRGVHATALVAKALIRQFYGQAARFSYFSGCSDGGREALMEAQRYPKDFDGIAAGAPAMNFLVQNTIHHAWDALASDPGLKGAVLTSNDMPILHAAALAACDAIDGVRDGLISDPLRCRFDPHTAVCKSGQTGKCLSRAAADAAMKIYDGARDAEGRKLDVGGLMPGSELAWPGVAVIRGPSEPGQGPSAAPGALNLPASVMFASETIHYLAYPKPLGPDWKFTDFKFDDPTLAALRAMHGIYDTTDPDLSRFAANGGKLLIWHGWQDQHISPANTVAYTQAVADMMGAERAAQVLRTFLIPGMYHCGGGDGLTSIDVLTPLMAWVEDGLEPESIIASRNDADAAKGMGRRIYAWPAASELKSGADPDLPGSWVRATPKVDLPKLYASWLGADFYRSGYRRECGFDGEQYICQAAQ